MKNDHLLTDEDLRSLSEATLFSEGEACLWVEEDGVSCGGLWYLAEQVSKASDGASLRIRSREGRIIFALRNFYLLGVLRGGEAYRSSLLPVDAEELPDVPFVLDEKFSKDFVDSLNGVDSRKLGGLLALLGLADCERGVDE